MRVFAGANSYLMKGIGREGFLKQYREAWDRVRLYFTPLLTHNETIEFTSPEQLSLRQRIALYWLYVYNV